MRIMAKIKKATKSRGYGSSVFDKRSMEREVDDLIVCYRDIHELGQELEAEKSLKIVWNVSTSLQ